MSEEVKKTVDTVEQNNQEGTENANVASDSEHTKPISQILSWQKKEENKNKEEISQESNSEKIKKGEKSETKEKESPIQKEEVLDSKSEREIKLEKNFAETKKWGSNLSQKLKSFEKRVNLLAENGALTAEEAKELLKESSHETIENDSQSPWIKYASIWDKEVENMRKYGNDDNIDKYINAFQNLLHNAKPSELDNILNNLSDYEESDIKLTRQMLNLGKEYYDDIYKDIEESGSVKNMKLNYQEKLAKQQKKIDKLEAEIVKLKDNSDYIKNTSYSLPSGGSKTSPESHDNSVGNILHRSRTGTL